MNIIKEENYLYTSTLNDVVFSAFVQDSIKIDFQINKCLDVVNRGVKHALSTMSYAIKFAQEIRNITNVNCIEFDAEDDEGDHDEKKFKFYLSFLTRNKINFIIDNNLIKCLEKS